MPKWGLTAIIVGSRLPAKPLDVLDCTIAPMEQPMETIKPSDVPDKHRTLDGQTARFTIQSPYARFQAYHSINTRVEADTDIEALELATDKFGRAAAALGLLDPLSPPPIFYVIERVRLTDEGEVAGEYEFPGTMANVGKVEIAELSDGEMEELRGLLNVVGDDRTAGDIMDLWFQANALHYRAFTTADRANTVIACCLILERIAQELAPNPEEVMDEARVLAALIDLDIALDQGGELSDLTRELRKAWAIVREERVEHTPERLRRAADLLGLPDGAKTAALEAWDIRSSRAGHRGGKPVKREEASQARMAALYYLVGFLHLRSKQQGEGSG